MTIKEVAQSGGNVTLVIQRVSPRLAGVAMRRRVTQYMRLLMCGIVGYVGPAEAAPILLDGLRRLEYRG